MNERTAKNRSNRYDLKEEIRLAIVEREQSAESFPGRSAVEAMEEPLFRLMGATMLFNDLTMVSGKGPAPSSMGLSFLAQSMNCEAMRLFRLFHGHPPKSP